MECCKCGEWVASKRALRRHLRFRHPLLETSSNGTAMDTRCVVDSELTGQQPVVSNLTDVGSVSVVELSSS